MSRRTLQNKVRIYVVAVHLTRFVRTFVVFKNAIGLFNSFLLYRPDNCSEMHAVSHFVMKNIGISVK